MPSLLQLSKIIKHLQAQLDQQEAIGETLEAQLAKSHADLERLYALEAAQEDIIQQVRKL